MPPNETPARGGRLSAFPWPGSAVGAGPCDARNVRSADADIGQLAIPKLGLFAQARVVAPPGLQEFEEGEQHGSPFSARPEWPGNRSTGNIKFHIASQQAKWCAAATHEMNGSCHHS